MNMKRAGLLLLLLVGVMLLLTSCDFPFELVGDTTTTIVTTEPEAVVTTAPHTAHHYTAAVYEATCCWDGFTRYTCACGDTYTDGSTPKTYRHDFSFEVLGNGLSGEYVCNDCGLKAVQYGKTLYYGETDCYYYVTAEHTHGEGYEIVIFGEGDMPDYGDYVASPWDNYLPEASSIVIADGVTSVGTNAFRFWGYELDHLVTYSISDTVTRLGAHSLWMKTSSLVLGNSVERIEEGAIDGVQVAVYLPSSLTYFYPRVNIRFYYEGTLDELYALETPYLGKTVTLRERLENFPVSGHQRLDFFVNASDITDDEEYWR